MHLDLIMMFMEIISVKIIIGHREQRDGDINHVIMTRKLILITACKWVLRVIKCTGLLDRKLIFVFFRPPSGMHTRYSTQFCFISYFFHKVFLRGEASRKAHP